MIVETFLEDLFSQIPDVEDSNGNLFEVKYGWGGIDDLNLYMQQESGNRMPLIWFENDKISRKSSEYRGRIRLNIAKSSEHKTSRNYVVWASEFKNVLDPLLEKVIKCFEQSGMTTIVNQSDEVWRRANFSQTESGTETKTIDHWNVIIWQADVIFTETATKCIQTINF